MYSGLAANEGQPVEHLLKKWKVLPTILGEAAPELVIAFGTAASEHTISSNGCVVVGTRAFAHNPFADDPSAGSGWTGDCCDEVLLSSLDPEQDSKRFSAILGDTSVRANINLRLLSPPNDPASEPLLFVASNYAAVSDVNVLNYDDFAWADAETLSSFQEHSDGSPIGSLETTHAVIRIASDAPFMFVSGIANRFLRFNKEAATNDYAQNFVAAHNAGVVIAWLMPQLLVFK